MTSISSHKSFLKDLNQLAEHECGPIEELGLIWKTIFMETLKEIVEILILVVGSLQLYNFREISLPFICVYQIWNKLRASIEK